MAESGAEVRYGVSREGPKKMKDGASMPDADGPVVGFVGVLRRLGLVGRGGIQATLTDWVSGIAIVFGSQPVFSLKSC